MKSHTDNNVKNRTYFPRSVRLLLTGRCNLSCYFCFQEGWAQEVGQKPLKTDDHIRILRTLVTEYGIRKLRLSGGEPLLAPNHFELLSLTCQHFGDLDIGITTNASTPRCLEAILTSTALARIRINISLHATKETRWHDITGKAGHTSILSNIHIAAKCAKDRTKINCVFIPGRSENDAVDVITFARSLNLPVKLLCLQVNAYNAEAVAKRSLTPYPFEYVMRFLADQGYTPERNIEGGVLTSNCEHVVQAVECCEHDPITYYRRFRTLRIMPNSDIAVTGDRDGYCRALNPRDPAPSIRSIVDDIVEDSFRNGNGSPHRNAQ